MLRCAVAALVVFALLTVALAVSASAATPAQICQSTKNKVAGSYDLCRHKAEARYATTADGAARTLALSNCLAKYNLNPHFPDGHVAR